MNLHRAIMPTLNESSPVSIGVLAAFPTMASIRYGCGGPPDPLVLNSISSPNAPPAARASTVASANAC